MVTLYEFGTSHRIHSKEPHIEAPHVHGALTALNASTKVLKHNQHLSGFTLHPLIGC